MSNNDIINAKKKNLFGDQSSSSRLHKIIKGTNDTEKKSQPAGPVKNTTEQNSIRNALSKTRGGGYTIPPKVSAVVEYATREIIKVFSTVGSTTWRVPRLTSRVAYLIVGGGGGGSGSYDNAGAGGGGAGSVIYGVMTVYPGTIFNVVVGDGGDGGVGVGTVASPYSAGYSTDGSGGAASVFYNFVANGGQGGYNRSGPPGQNNGSGGALATAVSGGGGGHGGGGNGGGGGGGGNGSAGGSSSGTTGGSPGTGVSNNLSGAVVTYGAGGRGGTSGTTSNGSASVANSGNGGDGAGAASYSGINGRKGGSGIVILRYME